MSASCRREEAARLQRINCVSNIYQYPDEERYGGEINGLLRTVVPKPLCEVATAPLRIATQETCWQPIPILLSFTALYSGHGGSIALNGKLCDHEVLGLMQYCPSPP